MSITFTRYLRPDGRQEEVEIEMPSEIESMAKVLISQHKCYLDIEVLRTGIISITCEIDDPEMDRRTISHELSVNGPQITEHVERLIRNAFDYFRPSAYER